jgi:hypothetical protein
MNQNPDKNCSAPYNDAVRKALRVRRNDLQRTIEIKSTSKDYVTRQRERQAGGELESGNLMVEIRAISIVQCVDQVCCCQTWRRAIKIEAKVV